MINDGVWGQAHLADRLVGFHGHFIGESFIAGIVDRFIFENISFAVLAGKTITGCLGCGKPVGDHCAVLGNIDLVFFKSAFMEEGRPGPECRKGPIGCIAPYSGQGKAYKRLRAAGILGD